MWQTTARKTLLWFAALWRKIMVLVEAWSNHPVRLTWIKGLSSSTESLASTPSSFLLRVHLQNPPPPPFLSSSPWIEEYYAIQHHVKEHNSFYFEMAILKFQDLLLHSAKSLLSIAWPLRAHVHKVSVSSWSCVKWWSGVRFDFWACESRKLVIYLSVYIMARISTIYGNQIVTEYLVFIVFIIDYKSGIRDRKLRIITCI